MEQEKKLVNRERELHDLAYEEVPLSKMRTYIAELAAKYGEDARLYITGSDVTVEIKYQSPETDYELKQRLDWEQRKADRRAALEAAKAALTPEQLKALNL